MNLTDFLLARIAEDEAAARHDDVQPPWVEIYKDGSYFTGWDDRGGSYLAVDPARVLADCEAKRRIVEEWGRVERFGTNGFGPGVLRHLASVYANHPDYREEWRA